MLIALAVALVLFGSAAYVGIEVGAWLGSRAPGRAERPARPAYLAVLLVGATAAIGAVLVSRHVHVVSVFTIGFVCVCLCAAWWSDVAYGVVPDALVIAPLAVVLIDALARREWGLPFAALVTALPFAVVSLATKGRGAGRADGEIAALGGALLGLQTAIVAYALACFALFAVNLATKNRGTAVAATPYMAAGIVGGMLLKVLVA